VSDKFLLMGQQDGLHSGSAKGRTKAIMTRQEFFHGLEEAIGLERDSIRGDESLKDLRGWDSMGMVGFIALADERLETLVVPAMLVRCETVSDLIALFPGKIS
jgi:acyl carrier protein